MTGTKNCKSCKRSVGKKFKLQCGDCKGYFHLDCGGVSEVDARLMQAEKTPWSCSLCCNMSRRQSSLFQPAVNPDNARRQSVLFTHADGTIDRHREEQGEGELKMMIRELQNELREVMKTMEFFNARYEDEKKRTKVLSDMVTEMSRDNQLLRQEINRLKVIVDIEQNVRIQKNICITGLMDANDQHANINEKLFELCGNIGVHVSASDVESSRKITTKGGVKAIICLKTLEIKQKIMQARAKRGKLTVNNTGLGESSRAIYIDEELTKDMYILFKKTRAALKEIDYKYVWHRNGRILARKMDGDQPIVIRSEVDLENLL